MLKSVVSISAAVALLAPLSLSMPANAENSGVQLAQMQKKKERILSQGERERDDGGDRMREIMDNREKCNGMMKQFDAAKTTNTEAAALRKMAEQHCSGSSSSTVDRGVGEMEDALKMIGIKPAYN